MVYDVDENGRLQFRTPVSEIEIFNVEFAREVTLKLADKLIGVVENGYSLEIRSPIGVMRAVNPAKLTRYERSASTHEYIVEICYEGFFSRRNTTTKNAVEMVKRFLGDIQRA